MAKHSFKQAISVLVMLVFVCSCVVVAFGQGGADEALSSARQQLVDCYYSARQAESAGANISSLTSKLNVAGDLLSRSQLAYSRSDYSGSQTLASECSQSLDGFVSEANALRDAAVQKANFDFWVYFVGSIAGAFAVILAGFVVWRVLKKRHSAGEVLTDKSS